MKVPEAEDSFPQDDRVLIAEKVLQALLGDDCKVDLNAKCRMLILLSTETPCILAQQQFTPNESHPLHILSP